MESIVEIILMGLTCTHLHQLSTEYIDQVYKMDGKYDFDMVLPELEGPQVDRFLLHSLPTMLTEDNIPLNVLVQYCLDYFQSNPYDYCVNVIPFWDEALATPLGYILKEAHFNGKLPFDPIMIYSLYLNDFIGKIQILNSDVLCLVYGPDDIDWSTFSLIYEASPKPFGEFQPDSILASQWLVYARFVEGEAMETLLEWMESKIKDYSDAVIIAMRRRLNDTTFVKRLIEKPCGQTACILLNIASTAQPEDVYIHFRSVHPTGYGPFEKALLYGTDEEILSLIPKSIDSDSFGLFRDILTCREHSVEVYRQLKKAAGGITPVVSKTYGRMDGYFNGRHHPPNDSLEVARLFFARFDRYSGVNVPFSHNCCCSFCALQQAITTSLIYFTPRVQLEILREYHSFCRINYLPVKLRVIAAHVASEEAPASSWCSIA